MKKEKETKIEETLLDSVNDTAAQEKPKRKYTRKKKDNPAVSDESQNDTLIQSDLSSNDLQKEETSLLDMNYNPDMGDDQVLSESVNSAIAVDSEEERQRIIDEHNRRVMQSPEFQAEYMYNNYLRTCGQILDGQTRRRLKKQFLHNAKKGKFKRFFDPEMIARRQQREQEKFDKLNAPVIHTVDDIPEDTQEVLKKMAEMEVPVKSDK